MASKVWKTKRTKRQGISDAFRDEFELVSFEGKK